MHPLRWLLPYLRRHRTALLAGAACVLLANLAWAFTPRLVGYAVDSIIAGGTLPKVLPALAGILGLTLVGGVLTFLMRQTIIVSSRTLEYELRNDLVRSLERHSARFFLRYLPAS
jgi:ATP-binding cassette subfamily B multidrug efflux pump